MCVSEKSRVPLSISPYLSVPLKLSNGHLGVEAIKFSVFSRLRIYTYIDKFILPKTTNFKKSLKNILLRWKKV